MEFRQRRRIDTGQDGGLQRGLQSGQAVAGTAPSVRNLRKPRHAGLFEAVHRLDVGLDPGARDELARWIRDQYAVDYGDIPMGFVAQCYLGLPYVDHRLDLLHDILDHFSAVQAMPQLFEGARMLARSGAYAYVEVYASGLVAPVLPDGTVVVIDSPS